MPKVLMISLDKRILEPSSPVAARMAEYGLKEQLCILIPTQKKISVDISPAVRAEGTGGGKVLQFFRLLSRGRQLLRSEEVEKITTQDPFFTGLAGFLLRTPLVGGRTGKKVRLEVQLHGDFFPASGGGRSTYYRQWGSRILLATFVLRRADTIRAAGERVRQSVVRLGIPQEKVTVRPIAVNREAIRTYSPKTDLHRTYPQFGEIFLVLSRLDPVKNIPWLVAVFADVVKTRPRAGLVVVGKGPDERRIQRAIDRYNLGQSVIREPWTDDPWSYLKTADALLLPSVSEGYGLVALEAHAAGTPIIMTDVGVANYELKPSADVTIVPVGDKKKFKQAIINVNK